MKQKSEICEKIKNFFKKSKKAIDFNPLVQYNLNVRRKEESGGANLEKRTTKVKKPENALS